MARARNGQAIGEARRTPEALAELESFTKAAEGRGDLNEWRRGRGLQLYISGSRVVEIAAALDVGRATVNQWLRWYETMGVHGLATWKQPGAPPRLSEEQRAQLIEIIEKGPLEAGFSAGVWNGPMIGLLIRDRFGVTYHNHHIPRLLHQLGFSVQRPRKRLARADEAAQATWIRETFPEVKKKRRSAVAS